MDGATVTASLYAGRDADNPGLIPGVAVPAFSGQVLTPMGGGDYYEVAIGDDPVFDPPAGTNYRLVVDAAQDGAPVGHWEQTVPVVVNS